MEITVVGRRTDVTDRFREVVVEKLAKVGQLAPRAQRIDVEVTRETNPSLAEQRERVELTVVGKGPIIRAEAAGPDRNVAFDLAVDKLAERLRRARDRAKNRQKLPIHEVFAEPVEDVQAAAALAKAVPAEVLVDAVDHDVLVETEADAAEVMAAVSPQGPLVVDGAAVEQRLGDSPVIIRQKLHTPDRLSIADAVEQMELIGHDFYLFIDTETNRPSAVYRRKGWTYGVIQLDAAVG
ncbi:MAG: ribosome-associated translation inhibitor RaiA [Promicromonosporaceae bacterium]|nr:ribosome-associated translation inhibitor RaiA [Promicromonosporaceae bacterium]